MWGGEIFLHIFLAWRKVCKLMHIYLRKSSNIEKNLKFFPLQNWHGKDVPCHLLLAWKNSLFYSGCCRLHPNGLPRPLVKSLAVRALPNDGANMGYMFGL